MTLQFNESSIPTALREVHAEVLFSDTPIQLVRLAAGEHQKLQSERREMTTEDICRVLATTMHRKMYSMTGNGEAALGESELFLALETMGVVSENKMPTGKRNSKKSQRELMVC